MYWYVSAVKRNSEVGTPIALAGSVGQEGGKRFGIRMKNGSQEEDMKVKTKVDMRIHQSWQPTR